MEEYSKKYLILDYNERVSKKRLIEHLTLECDLGDITCKQLQIILKEIIDFPSDPRSFGNIDKDQVRYDLNQAAKKSVSIAPDSRPEINWDMTLKDEEPAEEDKIYRLSNNGKNLREVR